MILAKIYGGLGNQLFQYAASRALALRNKTELKLDISAVEKPDSHNRIYGLHHFNITAPVATEDEIRSFLKKKTKLFKYSKYLLNKTGIAFHPSVWHQTYMYQSFYDKKFLKPLTKNIYLDGYWQNEELFNEYRSEILKDLSLKSQPDELNSELLEQIRNVNSVSLHVRRGDALAPAALLLYKLPGLEFYNKAIELISSKVANPVFYIFSDDIAWCQQNIVTGFPAVFVSHNNDATNYEDLRLMSNCKHHITANSSFSWWGAWLNPSETKIVISPEKWFHPAKFNRNKIVPPSWIKL